MQAEILAGLTDKNDKAACALADRIVAESREADTWYEYLNGFAALLEHPKSYVRNRALHILAVNARWDAENRLDAVLPTFLSHITDASPSRRGSAFRRWRSSERRSHSTSRRFYGAWRTPI